jgi:hypothetical protein
MLLRELCILSITFLIPRLKSSRVICFGSRRPLFLAVARTPVFHIVDRDMHYSMHYSTEIGCYCIVSELPESIHLGVTPSAKQSVM